METYAPRVNFQLLERFVNQRVTLVGQVESVEGGKAKIKACDGGVVYVELKNGNGAFVTPFVEMIGTVTSPTSFREESRVDFGSTLDANVYNELCKLSTGDYAQVFADGVTA